MVLGLSTLKAEGQHESRALSVPGTAWAFAVMKITDDHVTSCTNRERRSLERRVLQVHVHDLFGSNRCFALLVEVHIHRQRLAVGPLPCAALTRSHPGLNGRCLRRAQQATHLSCHGAFRMTGGCHEDSAKREQIHKFHVAHCIQKKCSN